MISRDVSITSVTGTQLDNICGVLVPGVYVHSVNDTLKEFSINTLYRVAAFLATIIHESGRFVYTAEIASGEAYEGRIDLGNIHPGDGKKYKGRGLIDITGLANYMLCQAFLKVPIVDNPKLLEEPELATRSAGWFWSSKNLNAQADLRKFGTICHIVNGGYNGLDSRINYFVDALRILSNESS